MKTPASILPSRPLGPGIVRGPSASPPPASAPRAPSHDDETLGEGVARRWRDLQGDVRARDLLVMLILALPCWAAIFWLSGFRPFNWTIEVDSTAWQWLTTWLDETTLGGGVKSLLDAATCIRLVKAAALVGIVSVAAVIAAGIFWWGKPGATVALLVGGLLYSYWPSFLNTGAIWNDPQYSHGWLVPLCSLALVFWWRQPLEPVPDQDRLAGLGLIAGSFLFRLGCAYFRIITLDMYTFVPVLAGVCLMVGGWKTFRWAWAPIAVLIFMYPLPDEATRYLLAPMQTLATQVSTFALQTLGLDAYRDGNRIILGESQVLGVVDACSGLRMLTIFVWLAVMIVLVAGGEWWENALIVASSLPIALAVNAIRITVTGIMYTINPAIAEKIFHDWAGYFMMPLALVFLFGVQQVLSWVVVDEEVAPSVVVPGRRPGLSPALVSAGRKAAENPPQSADGPAGGP